MFNKGQQVTVTIKFTNGNIFQQFVGTVLSTYRYAYAKSERYYIIETSDGRKHYQPESRLS